MQIFLKLRPNQKKTTIIINNINPNIDLNRLPTHIAIIMDGNGRWAKKQGAMRVFGHKNAIKAVREASEGCAELGVKYLTLYAFSTENWLRPQKEVDALMELLVHTIRGEAKTLTKNNISLQCIGDIESLPKKCQKELAETIEITSKNTGLVLVLALSYSGRWDIVQAMQKIATDVKNEKINAENINNDLITSYLSTKNMPDPELLIRTSGELRISNFLLWQMAYTEIFIDEVLWPDFRRENLHNAIINYQQRERRFGKTSEQLS